MAIKRYSAFLKAPASLEPHHQIAKCHIQDTGREGSLTPLQRCSQCILQCPSQLDHRTLVDGESPTSLQKCSWCILQPPPQPTGSQDTGWEEFLPLCRSAVGVFYSPPPHTHSRLGKYLFVDDTVNQWFSLWPLMLTSKPEKFFKMCPQVCYGGIFSSKWYTHKET